MKVLELLELVQGECIVSDAEQRFPEAAVAGDYVRQGDVYVWMLDGVPQGVSPAKASLQVVEGTTKGSRHCLDSLAGVEMFVMPDADVLTGPVLRLSEERVLNHPEHGDWILGPGCYAITYQRQFAEELKRAMD